MSQGKYIITQMKRLTDMSLLRNRLGLVATLCASIVLSCGNSVEAQFSRVLNQSQADDDEAVVNVTFTPVGDAAGKEAVLSVELNIPEGRNTYSTNREFKGATRIAIQSVAGLTAIDSEFIADHPPTIEYEPLFKQTVEKYKNRVVWSRRFRVDSERKSEEIGAVFYVRFQVCNNTNCKSKTLFYQATLAGVAPLKKIDEATLAGAVPFADDVVETPKGPSGPAADPNDPFFSGLQYQDDEAGGDLAWFLFSAFIGGMILNIMPCVLPVLAIKILSFVQQAGESRSRIFLLNLSYTFGVLTVFLILATLAVTVNLGWGGLFQSSEFNLIMSCIVFAMGLSLLGVFEIPVPGFVGSAAGNTHQEGLLGAFMTGIFATLLATPCSGPFLGATLGWSVSQPPPITFLIWGTMGLGMAFPYLLFGIFPFAIRWLPKPGMWMVRFKEFSGFVLMGTVIFLMNSLREDYTMPLLVMLLGISLGLWMIGNLYDVSSHIRHKLSVRISALLLTVMICGYGYSMTLHSAVELPWQDFSQAKLKQELQSGKTVLVDFTADWCLTCKTVEKLALNTTDTLAFVQEHNVATLVADYTEESAEIKSWLDRFQSKSVPLTVIFPAGDHKRPILIRDVYTKSKLLNKLANAVETKTKVTEADTTKTTASRG